MSEVEKEYPTRSATASSLLTDCISVMPLMLICMTPGFHLQPSDLRLAFVLDKVSVVKLHHIDAKSEQGEARISLKSVKHFNLGASTDLTIRKLITRQLKTSSSYII